MSITKKSKIYSTCLFIFFVIVAIITLLPLALLAVSSLRPGSDLMRYGLNFSIDWANANLNEYKMLFSGANSYFVWYKNSLIITVVQVALALFLSACVGYGFAMYNFKGKNILFLCVLLVMMIPTEVILLPLYRLIVKMGLINNMWGIILPYLVVPMLVFFFRQYLMGIPKDFLDAARVDGCTEYGIFFKIMIPVCKPIIAVLALWSFVGMWNSYFDAMIYLNDSNLQPLQLVLRSILVQNTPQPGMIADIQSTAEMAKIAEQLKYATIVVSSLPLLVMYPFFQKYFDKGIMVGSVKG